MTALDKAMQRSMTSLSSSSTDSLRKPIQQSPQYIDGSWARLAQRAVDRVPTSGVRREPKAAVVEQGVDYRNAAGPHAVEERRLAGGEVDGVRVELQFGSVVEKVDSRRTLAGAGRLHEDRATTHVD